MASNRVISDSDKAYSDHVPVVCGLRVKLKNITHRKKAPKRDLRLLREDKNVRSKFQEEAFPKIEIVERNQRNSEETYSALQDFLVNSVEKVVQKEQKVKLLSKKKRICSAASCIQAKDGTVLLEKNKILERCEECVRDLYDYDRNETPLPSNNTDGPPILKEEVRSALNKMLYGKAPGPDLIHTEMMEALEDLGVEKITRLSNLIYQESQIPVKMCKSIFITLPKKLGANKCELHRTISLKSHVTKLVLRILLERIKGRTIGEMADEQYGFSQDKGTRNAIFIMRMLSERAIEMQHDLYLLYRLHKSIRHCAAQPPL
ncbi:uncharacterized protein LOC110248415 [Exaiptasia diaphana]|uniref:Reverse transcriptase domain-containing protein n=1 Tax=Exaiptasia diaphana TaxID=2652724 RepID=A0A913XVU3_EXADI|nr:uncharacterized protein LOC110248415 [Exaiptasia diaphana]